MKTYIITILLLLGCLSSVWGQVGNDSHTVDTIQKIFIGRIENPHKLIIDKKIYKKDIVYLKTGFEDTITITDSKFEAQLWILNCSFNDNTIFKDVSFETFLFSSRAKQNIQFVRTTFNQFTSFENSDIEGGIYFYNVTIKKFLDFYGTKFKRTLHFQNIHLGDSSTISFYNSTLPDTIVLTGIQHIKNEIDLTEAKISDTITEYTSSGVAINKIKRRLVCLYKSDIPQIHLNYINFKLLLTDPSNGKELNYDESCSQYEALLNNFKTRGQSRSYELCDIEYQDYIWHNKDWTIKWLYVFPKYWNNYGYDKGRVFLWTLFFLILFTIITNWLFLDVLNNKVYQIKSVSIVGKPIHMWRDKNINKLNRQLAYSRWWNAFVYTASIFFLISLKVDRLKYEKKGAVLYLMTMYIMGIICLAYMANYIITR